MSRVVGTDMYQDPTSRSGILSYSCILHVPGVDELVMDLKLLTQEAFISHDTSCGCFLKLSVAIFLHYHTLNCIYQSFHKTNNIYLLCLLIYCCISKQKSVCKTTFNLVLMSNNSELIISIYP